MASIFIHRDAIADLDAIWTANPDAAAAIETLLQEASVNDAILQSFTVHQFGAARDQKFYVTRWVEQQNKGRNLWALKVWELEAQRPKYRVVYAFHPQKHVHYVLGAFTRDFDYDENDSRTQRVLAVYNRLGIPEYK